MENLEQNGQDLEGQSWNLQDPLAVRPSVVAEKIKILSDPNIATILKSRHIFFERSSHEFLLIQSMFNTAAETLMVATSKIHFEVLTDSTRAVLSLAAFCMITKGLVYLRNFHAALDQKVNVFRIQGLDMYSKFKWSDSDREYMKKIASLDKLPYSVPILQKRCLECLENYNALPMSLAAKSIHFRSSMDPQSKLEWASATIKLIVETLMPLSDSYDLTRALLGDYIGLLSLFSSNESAFAFYQSTAYRSTVFKWEAFIHRSFKNILGKHKYYTFDQRYSMANH
jgi:hypothetical protein